MGYIYFHIYFLDLRARVNVPKECITYLLTQGSRRNHSHNGPISNFYPIQRLQCRNPYIYHNFNNNQLETLKSYNLSFDLRIYSVNLKYIFSPDTYLFLLARIYFSSVVAPLCLMCTWEIASQVQVPSNAVTDTQLTKAIRKRGFVARGSDARSSHCPLKRKPNKRRLGMEKVSVLLRRLSLSQCQILKGERERE